MSVFSFQTVPNLRFGESAAEALAPMVEGYGARRLMLITDPGVRSYSNLLTQYSAPVWKAASVE